MCDRHVRGRRGWGARAGAGRPRAAADFAASRSGIPTGARRRRAGTGCAHLRALALRSRPGEQRALHGGDASAGACAARCASAGARTRREGPAPSLAGPVRRRSPPAGWPAALARQRGARSATRTAWWRSTRSRSCARSAGSARSSRRTRVFPELHQRAAHARCTIVRPHQARGSGSAARATRSRRAAARARSAAAGRARGRVRRRARGGDAGREPFDSRERRLRPSPWRGRRRRCSMGRSRSV